MYKINIGDKIKIRKRWPGNCYTTIIGTIETIDTLHAFGYAGTYKDEQEIIHAWDTTVDKILPFEVKFKDIDDTFNNSNEIDLQ